MSIGFIWGCIALICCVVAMLIYYSKAHYIFKIAIYPALAGVFAAMYLVYIAALGAPINGLPTTKFIYISHIIVDNGREIIMWADTKEKGQRLYEFPYSCDTAKQLENARKAKRSGQPSTGHVVRGAGKNTGQSIVFESGDAIHTTIPKEGN